MSNFAAAGILSDDLGPPMAPRSLVQTKLYPPRLRANLVPRPNLISLLNNDPGHRLTLICGPAGYGKSTLVAQWLAELALPYAWISLERTDNNPQAFFGLIVSALQSIDQGLLVATETLVSKQTPIRADAIVYQLIEEISAITRPVVLVLDDYHAIESGEIHHAIDILLQHLPDMMRLVVISRTQLPLQLARLRANGEICELRREELSFTHAEALHFYQVSLGLDLTPSEIKKVHERTEGWVAGLYLASFALRGKPRDRVGQYVEEFAGDVQFGNQYLWEEVLENQPDDVRTFLFRTSILDRFTAGLCDAVTETQSSEALIRHCERDNLFFIPLDGQGSWYRYHHLFAEVLRERLTKTATDSEIQDLHLRASEWLEQNGYLEDAVRHAIASHVWERATRLLEKNCSSLFDRDDVATLRMLLEGLPPEILERSPRLSFWLAWALGRTGRWGESTRVLQSAERLWTNAGDRPGKGLLLLWHTGKSLFSNENQKAIEYAGQALAHLSDDQPTERVFALMALAVAHMNLGDPVEAEKAFADVRMTIDMWRLHPLQPFEMAFSSMLLIQQGKLEESTVLSRRAIQNAGEMPTEMWAQAALTQLGRVYFEWGYLDDARRWLQKADDLAEMTRALQMRAQIRCGLARISWARGDIEEAFDEIDRAIGFARQLGTLNEIRSARAQQARFWLASHQVGLARRWADSCELDPYLPPEYERQEELLTYVRLLIQEGRPDFALEILKGIREQAEASGRYGELVEILLLSALAHKANENIVETFNSLRGALSLGEPRGYLRVFVDEGDDLAPLLRHAAARGDRREYARRILAEIEGAPIAEQLGKQVTTGTLSEREIEVLRMVAAGMSNRDIGQRLFISEKTVKTHLSNILGKLEAANRAQAVDQARRLGLI